MGRNGCGCNGDSTPPPNDGLLIKASGKSAARCGEGNAAGAGGAEACVKDDSTYDITLNAYTVPAHGQNAPITVCDGSLYTPGQWIQFLFVEAILQVQVVNGNVVTLKNGCPNNAEIPGNTAGDIVAARTPFVVIAAPACMTSAQIAADFQSKMSTQTELLLPNLVQENSNTAEMQFVGWKRADSNDSNFKKSIRRIRHVWKKGKSIFLGEIEVVPSADIALYRSLMRHKTTGEVRELVNVSENPDLPAGEKFVMMYVEGAERLVGPAYVYTPTANDVLYENSELDDHDSWVNIPEATPLEQTINLSIAAINDLEILGDNFYPMVQFNIGCRHPSGFATTMILEVNGVPVTRTGAQGFPGFNSVCIPVKVTKADKKIDIKVTTTSPGSAPKCHVSAVLRGVQL